MLPMDAHLIRQGEGRSAYYKVLCGWGHPCTGALGELRQPLGASLISLYFRNVDTRDANATEWLLSSKQGFRRDGDGYRLIKDMMVRRTDDGMQRRRGLGGGRPVPEHLRTANIEHQDGWGIIGERPELPALIYCPRCGRPNTVPVPPVDEARERAV